MKKHIPINIYNESGCLAYNAMKLYIKGNLGEAEKTEVERHLAECVFCSEAMEGLGKMDDHEKMDQMIDDIDHKVDQVVGKQVNIKKPEIKRIDKTWMYISAAASVLVLVGIFTLYRLQEEPMESMISERITTSKPQEETIALDKGMAEETVEKMETVEAGEQEKKDEIVSRADVPEKETTDKTAPASVSEQPDEPEKESLLVMQNEDIVTEEKEINLKELEEEISVATEGEASSAPVEDEEFEMEELAVVGYSSMKKDKDISVARTGSKSSSALRSRSAPRFYSEEDKVFYKLEEMPTFRGGGKDVFRQYIQENIKYPADAVENEKEGQVIVEFTVTHKGKVKDVAVVEGISPSLDKEAVRVVSASPDWSPGIQNGKPVDVRFKFAVNFNLND